MNHFDEFAEFVYSQKIISKEFRHELMGRVSAAMNDAYDRGVKSVKPRKGIPIGFWKFAKQFVDKEGWKIGDFLRDLQEAWEEYNK